MTDHDTMPDYDLDDDWEADEEPLPKRPRRRLVTPISATLAGALVGALGFIGGVEVQKSQDDGSSGGNGAASAFASAGGSGAARGGFARGGGPQFGGGQSNATVGSVANKKGSTLYVKDSDGNLVRVKTTSHSKINRTASITAGAIHPGDTVIVQGETAASGTVVASTIRATASNAGAAGLGGFGGGAPQGAPGGG